MNLGPSIRVVPILHGRPAFAAHVRECCMQERFDCVAVDLPLPFADTLPVLVDDLPHVTAAFTEPPADPVYLVPTDPADAAIEAIRQARQERIACEFLGSPELHRPALLDALPDEHSADTMGFDSYAGLCLHALGNITDNADIDREAQFIAWRLHQLRAEHSRILAVVHLRHCTRVVHHFGREQTHNLRFDLTTDRSIQPIAVNPDHLYFALGQLPFVTGRLERSRHDPFAPPFDPVAAVKGLFAETRDEYYDHRDDAVELSPARLQVALTFLRNLTVQSGLLLPSLFDIVAAAKGVGGNAYAVRILKSARYYPYLPVELPGDTLSVGIDQVVLPGEDSPREAVNLLKDTHTTWTRLSIKPDPSQLQKKRYRYHWNPTGMCSHVPEDRRIESFNVHLRTRALRVLSEDMAKSEKFTTSIRDGLDMRETLRNWYTGDIYVKELPPSRGSVDTVVLLFDQDHDERYPHCATWYAEHDEESTLTFYATDPMEDLIGPGIARARYGGLSLLFPPRAIPNVFQFTRASDFRCLGHQLTYGAMLYSKERSVVYVANRTPDLALRQLARKLGKHLVWLPLHSFSNETLRRLQRFHVLNGRVVRSWATRFIGD